MNVIRAACLRHVVFVGDRPRLALRDLGLRLKQIRHPVQKHFALPGIDPGDDLADKHQCLLGRNNHVRVHARFVPASSFLPVPGPVPSDGIVMVGASFVVLLQGGGRGR